MTVRPRLITSIPFWILIAGSVATAATGAAILVDKLSVMSTTLTDGTATGIEVYVGQSLAVLGAVLIGAGALGILLALTVATAASLRPAAPGAIAPGDDADAPSNEADDALGYEPELGYTEAEPVGAAR
ncbi:dinucleotide-utilizing enzyme [Microbacterium sp. ARD31]|jgi:hypothetical protein|uniref:dinucleotide-utilizing enzyme n=1 Tax=Microbacterium sp. ARD31 TaxID=2962576 RepID=UPI002882C7B2|nr:dinucleotide-utilizing enzyme [Microbacterium sp. ARD31]MDT0181217.1 dinucleotide-utilizing enzyme [Microbacterium sp. ARD31]